MNTGVLIFVWLCYLKGLKETALAEGAIRFISKPFSVADLRNVIFSLCPGLRAA